MILNRKVISSPVLLSYLAVTTSTFWKFIIYFLLDSKKANQATFVNEKYFAWWP